VRPPQIHRGHLKIADKAHFSDDMAISMDDEAISSRDNAEKHS